MERVFYAVSYVGALFASLAMTPLVVVLARRWGVIDLPDVRKVHQQPTPRLGGLAIAGSMIAVALIVSLVSGAVIDRRIVVVCVVALFVLAVGVFDDLLSLPGKFKLLALIAAACAVCGVGVRIDSILLHGYPEVPLGWLAWPVTILFLVGITVSMNFIDGLDGLAAGIAAIACAVVAVTASWSGQIALGLISLSLLGSLTGFLVFNFNPAKVFMGDCGSMFLGFTLACLSILQTPNVGTTVGLMLPVLALAIPILDTLFTLIRRSVIHRGSMFSAERGHIHHRLLDLGLCQRHAVLVLYAASLVSAGVGMLALLDHGWPTLAGLALLLPLLIGLFGIAGSTRMRETIAAIRRNRAIGRESRKYSRACEILRMRFNHVRDFEQWWNAIGAAGDMFDFVAIDLPLTSRDGSTRVLRWLREDGNHGGCEVLEAAVPIRQRRRGCTLRARLEVACYSFVETAGHRVALFARLMGDHSLVALPDTTKRVRALGPVGQESPPACSHGNGHSNGNGQQSRGSRNGSGNRHSNGNGNGNCNGNGNRNGHGNGNAHVAGHQAADLEASEDLASESTTIGRLPLKAIPESGETSAEVGISASPGSADLPSPHHAAPSDLGSLKVCVVHDFLYCYAGAERVLEQILQVFPQADLFSLFDFLAPDQRGFIQNKPVRTSFIQKLPFARRKHRAYLPLMPLAIEQLDVSQYDIVISSSYLAAKGVLTRPDQLHVCYCHTPVRFAWDLQHQYLRNGGLIAALKSFIPRLVFHYIRSWDVRSANSVDIFVTNSDYVGRRIDKIYRRRSTTIYPPVDTERFTPGTEKEDFFLTASRLVPYKRVDVIVEAFTRMPDRRLLVVGDGPEFDRIKATAGPNIHFVGHQPLEKLKRYMQLARAFVFAAEEDFGIVPVEAQACGTPVIAYGRGGATETVISGRSGVFFSDQTPESLIAAVEEFDKCPHWNQNDIRLHAERFSIRRFQSDLRTLIQSEWEMFLQRRLEPAISNRLSDRREPAQRGTDESKNGIRSAHIPDGAGRSDSTVAAPFAKVDES